MNKIQDSEAVRLRAELAKLLTTLKRNRENVSLDVLKTKYKTGYDTLCANIKRSASDYAKQIVLRSIRIHADYFDAAVSIINGTIAGSGILKQLSKAAFSHQDIAEFDSLAITLREKILAALESFYAEHLGLYITQECLENPEAAPLIYCAANNCVWQDGKWIPMELYNAASAYLPKKSA